MDHLCWITAFILISAFISEGEAERHHYRSRARHILIQNLESSATTTTRSPTTIETTQEPPSSTTRPPSDENDPSSRRRGSQPPDSYTEGEWDLIQQRIGNPPPGGSFDTDPDQDSRPDHQQNSQDSQPTQRPEGQGQVGNQDPFLNRMSAMDYLTRRAHGDILHSRNNQQNREFSREMGEQMCEAFGKHYVSISIGGKCV
ncbi:hypothetical protein LOTGIDRAFT_232582 [Lottia gigantea]|uniref:Uncharacterized protein n=1 Tax=Lottia gigantea TaxID=225164 RepID=V4AJ04_LOTGI|nr:hypothetical protein LOTGIDRAFT_232582 [Lottia gigantea]ESO93491.1 hypothetical protein LOTGIDRAFT_232582 [Lottia gigantea]